MTPAAWFIGLVAVLVVCAYVGAWLDGSEGRIPLCPHGDDYDHCPDCRH